MYFHCIIVETIAVCVAKAAIDPVTPIAGADFVTGNITDPTFSSNTGQVLTLFKFTGTQSNGSVDGTIVAVNDDRVSLEADLLFSTDTGELSLDNFGVFAAVSTDDNVTTAIGKEIEIPENKRLIIDVTFNGNRTDVAGTYLAKSISYGFSRKVGGSLQEDFSVNHYKNGPGSLQADIVVNSNNIKGEVKGISSQDWDWKILKFDMFITDIV